MIHPSLHKSLVALDRDKHRQWCLRKDFVDASHTTGLNSMFISAVEFGDACLEYPIVFVRAGKDPQTGRDEIAPVAVFGLTQGENLFVRDGLWHAEYVPAVLRAYPFAIAPVAQDNYAVCIDTAWAGFDATGAQGTPLFEADGAPSAYTREMQTFLEQIETEVQRTRLACRRIVELELLRDMRFDATLPDGQKLSVDGFLAVDEAKLTGLTDAQVVELHRSGISGLLHAHQVSLRNMKRLLHRRSQHTANA